MIQSYNYNNRKFSFLNSFPRNINKNNYTIVVGKNGTGKSTLLRSIVIDLLRENVAPTTLKNSTDISSHDREFRIGDLIYSDMPTKIICVSTSPFDKFPMLKRNQDIPIYSYLGLRGLPSQNLGTAYMARIIYTLISSAKKSSAHANAITTVLEYLDYEPELRVVSSITSPKIIDILMNESDAASRIDLAQYFERGTALFTENNILLKQLMDIDEKTFRHIRKALTRVLDSPKKKPILSILNRDSAISPTHPNILPEDLSLLSRYGLVKLREVVLRKRGVEEPLQMSDMSSGEQSVVMGLLGIGSQLQDGALICIDEPEVCLHPAWQERYIQLLSNIFSHYHNCHFIIATHSPQIVAQLPDDSCYVMDMEDGIAKYSDEFSKKSIDYQLASVFKAPGFKNEYLSRIALNVFITVAKNKAFNTEAIDDFKILESSYGFLSADDPVKGIIDSIKEMYIAYA